MDDQRARITIIILENRLTIAAILSDLLTTAGYRTQPVALPETAQEIMPQHLPAILLADLGMVRPEAEARWQDLQAAAAALNVPVLRFSCSPLPEGGPAEVMVLRSPGDFAMVVEKVEEEWHRKQPFLGMTLVSMGCLQQEELATALRIQRDLAQLDRHYTLGDLLLRLGMVGPEDLEEALHRQEPAE